MKGQAGKIKIGIVGCGAIGSRMAKSIQKDFGAYCQLTGIYDIQLAKAQELAKAIKQKTIVKKTMADLIKDCACMVEAVSAKLTRPIIRQGLNAKKTVLSMSVGKLLNARDLFQLAHKNKCHLLIPSGAIAGIDAIKAASLIGIDKITLTTRKPPSGFLGNAFLRQKGIDLHTIRNEMILFEGGVDAAVKIFPQNINVAATLALASQCPRKLTIKIITSPAYTMNSHEIEVTGKFGRIMTQTNNVVCPDNPKTSYLAVLSGLQTLKQYCSGVFIGT